MIRVRVSRRTLRAAMWVAFIAAALGSLYGLGLAETPRDEHGQPQLLSPSLRAAEKYRRRASRWIERMTQIDQRLTALLNNEGMAAAAEIVAQGKEMEEIGQETMALTREIQTAETPIAMASLRQQALETAEAYLETALHTARWLNEPSEARWREAVERLRAARALRMHLRENQWLTN